MLWELKLPVWLNPEMLEDVLEKEHLIHQFMFNLTWGFGCLILWFIFSET